MTGLRGASAASHACTDLPAKIHTVKSCEITASNASTLFANEPKLKLRFLICHVNVLLYVFVHSSGPRRAFNGKRRAYKRDSELR